MSNRFVRSPDAPKITIKHGSPGGTVPRAGSPTVRCVWISFAMVRASLYKGKPKSLAHAVRGECFSELLDSSNRRPQTRDDEGGRRIQPVRAENGDYAFRPLFPRER